MKRRLRKKRRLGEFREDCFEVWFQIDSALGNGEVDRLTDSFIGMIEQRLLQFGGGGHHKWHGIVQGPYRGSATTTDREFVLTWLQDHPSITSATAGPLRDAWHGWEK